MKRTHSLLFSGLAGLSLLASIPAHAQGALQINSVGDIRNDGSYSIGYQFTVGASNVTVSSLGVYVNNASLNTTHPVAIYNLNGSFVTGESGLVNVGPSTPKSADSFAYVAVTPFTLLAGTSYLIGTSTVVNDGDQFLGQYGTFSPSAGSGIAAINKPRYNNNGVDQPPYFDGGSGQAFVGPNFISAVPAAAPEPSAFAALGLGALGLMTLVARKRRVAA